jgi:hypothetical protein
MGILHHSVHLPADVLVELGEFTGIFWSSFELEPVICNAIRDYINPPQPAAQMQSEATTETGYQWKQVFLPEGTRLRASFGRTPYFAVVQGNDIRYGEHSVSPSGFANLQGSGNRNAWKAVWLRFPGSAQWVLADACRALQRAAIASIFAGSPVVAPAPDKPQRSAARPPARQPVAQSAAPHKNAAQRGKRGRRGKRRKHTAASTAGKT